MTQNENRSCPSRDLLETYVNGTATVEAADQIEAHVQTCSLCEAAIDELEQSQSRLLDPTLERIAGEGELQHAVRAAQARLVPPSDASTPLDKRIRDYELLEKIGEGGMGTVYRARHVRLGRIVALKLISPHLTQSSQALARFQREALAVGAVDHRHIVRAHDAGEENGQHYLATEFVDGANLRELVAAVGRVSAQDACAIICQAAEGVEHLHRNNVVHRDIKPANIFLSRDGIVKILDLGIAQLSQHVDHDLTATGQVMGTLGYMAPEQGENSAGVDVRADIYSLGATLYYLLVGEAPLAASRYSSSLQFAIAVAKEPRPPIASKRDDLPAGLAEVVDQQLSLSRDDRCSVPGRLREKLEPFTRESDLLALVARIPKQRVDQSLQSTPAFGTHTETVDHRSSLPSVKPMPANVALPREPRRRWWMWSAVASAASLFLILLTVFIISTRYGDVRVEIVGDDPGLTVTVDETELTIGQRNRVPVGKRSLAIRVGDQQLDVGNEITFSASADEKGKRQLNISVDGVKLVANEFEVTRQRETIVRIEITAPKKERVEQATPSVDKTMEREALLALYNQAEPPSLDEWLVGRKVITVAQDGRADHKTLAAAIASVQEGQAIEILDEGPYFESLRLQNAPADIGLFSRQEAIVWSTSRDTTSATIHECESMRLSGLTFVSESSDTSFTTNDVGTLILEHCNIVNVNLAANRAEVPWNLRTGSKGVTTVVIRDCISDVAIKNFLAGSNTEMRVIRNLFDGTSGHGILNLNPGGWGGAKSGSGVHRAVIQSNILWKAVLYLDPWWERNNDQQLLIANNTLLDGHSIVVDEHIREEAIPIAKHVALVNNIFQTERGLNPRSDLARQGMTDEWLLGWNAIHSRDPLPNAIPAQPTDVTGDPNFVSIDPANANFLRPQADTPVATAGHGGQLPRYIGALPPRGRSKEGDWFPKLMERRARLLKRIANIKRQRDIGQSNTNNGPSVKSERELVKFIQTLGGGAVFEQGSVGAADPLPAVVSGIKEIHLSQPKRPLTDNDVERLMQASELRTLVLNASGLSNAGIQLIAKCMKLEVLDLRLVGQGGQEPFDDALRPLGKLPQLQRLVLLECHVTGAFLDAFGDSPLQALVFDRAYTLTDDVGASLPKVPHLRELMIAHADKITGETVQGIGQSPELRKMEFINCVVSDKDMPHLEQTQLESLIFGWRSPPPGHYHFTDDTVASIAKIKTLKTLRVSWADRTGDKSLAKLKDLPLEELLLGSATRYTAAGLRLLSQCRTLKKLSLEGMHADSTIFAVLSSLPITELDLAHLQLKSDNFSAIRDLNSCDSLRSLRLDFVDLTKDRASLNETIASLGKLQQLRSLKLHNISLTKADIQQLRSLLKQCDVAASPID